jgi:glycosyltransferase involved in cell wall biosynthesis
VTKILIFIPTYNCSRQITRVLEKIPANIHEMVNLEILIIDNCSSDDTLLSAMKSIDRLGITNIRICQQQRNLGLGGSHKSAIRLCILENFDFLVVLHGDDQTTLESIPKNLFELSDFDCALGSRFMKGAKLFGYSKIRILGNRVLNFLYGVVLNSTVSDMGSGLNIYKVTMLRAVKWDLIPDDMTFNNFLLIETLRRGFRHHFFPIEWHEIDQRSNARLLGQTIKILGNLGHSLFYRDSRNNTVRGWDLVSLPNLKLVRDGSKE